MFLNTAALDPSARWLVFNKSCDPLMLINPAGESSAEETRTLALLSTAQVKPLLGFDRLFGQGQSSAEGSSPTTDVIEPEDHPELKILQAARLRGPKIVFLGVHEREGVQALPSNRQKTYPGRRTSYWTPPGPTLQILKICYNRQSHLLPTSLLSKNQDPQLHGSAISMLRYSPWGGA